MKKNSSLTFKDLCESEFGRYVKLVWNGKVIYEDKDDGVHIKGKLAEPHSDLLEKIQEFEHEYENKIIYSFKCKILHFHHTVLYVKGE